MYHVSNVPASRDRPDWNQIQVEEAKYRQYHGELLLGLPVAGFTIMPLDRNIYPFLGSDGKKYHRVRIPFNPAVYDIYKMNDHNSPCDGSKLHLLCIRKKDNNRMLIMNLLGSNRLLNHRIIDDHLLQQQACGRQGIVEKILYFIENIDIESPSWDKGGSALRQENPWDEIEKAHYDFGPVQNIGNNMTNTQLLFDAWVQRQVRRLTRELLYTLALYFL